MSVTWIQNGDGEFEISSPEHLKQLMHVGTLYTDAGTPPSNYLNSDYVQTIDIDLLGDSTNIKPIGVRGAEFSGDFNGAGYRISNWSYLDPTFTSASEDHADYVGLFGSARYGIIKNIVMDGVWTLRGFKSYAGFLAGSYSNAQLRNIRCDFSPGSEIESGPLLVVNNSRVGGVIGHVSGTVVGITLTGTIDFKGTSYHASGGVFGRTQNSTQSVTLVQNKATFPSGIVGQDVGGIVGYSWFTSTSYCINAMTGDLIASTNVGGITGNFHTADTSTKAHTLLNAMTGNIDCTGTAGAGGIFGRSRCFADSHTFINYMTGNITSASSNCGGMAGSLTSGVTELALTSSIVAMNGTVRNAVANDNYPNFVATVDTSFGMTFTTNPGTSSPPTGLMTNTEIPSLPYTEFIGTDSDGNTYDFDFLCANLSGNSLYDEYTHLVLHKGDIDTPFYVNFDVPENNTTLYYTYVNSITQVILQDSLSIALYPGEWTLNVRSINVVVSLGSVPDLVSFKITYQSPTGPEITASSGFTALRRNIVNLDPETQYTFRLYTDTGNGYELAKEATETTRSNESTNYVMSDFEDNGKFNLTSINDETREDFSGVMNTLFNTGDVVELSLVRKPKVETSFVKLGESLSIRQISGLLLPFSSSNGAGQDVTVVLSDDSTNVAVTYDESNNSINVNSNAYSPDDVFILDGKKVTVLEY